MYDLAKGPHDRSKVFGESVIVQVMRSKTDMTNAEKVHLLVKGTKEVQGGKQGATFYRIGVSVFSQVGPGSTLTQVVAEGGSKALADVIVPDAGMVQNMTSSGPLKPLWDDLRVARGQSALSLAHLPQTRNEVETAITSAQKQNNQQEVKALKNILKLYNSLGGNNVKIVD